MPKGKGRPQKREDKVTVKGDKETSKKLRQFQASKKANRDGAALREDGSIMTRAGSLENTNSGSGKTRAKFGMSRGASGYGELSEYGGSEEYKMGGAVKGYMGGGKVRGYKDGGGVCRGGGAAVSGTQFRGVK